MNRCLTAVRDENDNLYLYRDDGVYAEAQKWILQILCSQLMNQLIAVWTLNYEKEGLEAFRRQITTVVGKFGTDKYLNLKNGVLQLKTMKIYNYPPKIFSTVRLNITYNEKAKCPRFQQFIGEITNNDQERATVLQEIVGYGFMGNGESVMVTWRPKDRWRESHVLMASSSASSTGRSAGISLAGGYNSRKVSHPTFPKHIEASPIHYRNHSQKVS